MPVVMGCCASAGALPASGAARRAGAEYHQHGAAPHGDGAGAAAAQQMGGAVCAILLGALDTPRQCAGGGGLLAAKHIWPHVSSQRACASVICLGYAYVHMYSIKT